jgi:hypothetical protein
MRLYKRARQRVSAVCGMKSMNESEGGAAIGIGMKA